MLAGWLDSGIAANDITIVEPNAETGNQLKSDFNVHVVTEPEKIPEDVVPDVIIFAVKPQVMDLVVPAYARFSGPGTVFLSIAAGKTISYFQNLLGQDSIVVRAMPNTPAAVGRGITVLCANPGTSPRQKDLSGQLLMSVGETAWVAEEDLIDAVTALSGGGPAYVFLLVEVLTRAGVEAGLPEELSRQLARTTVAGSGELLHRAEEEPETLRQNVTSPGGTTAEALRVLMAEDGLQPLFNRAIAAAAARSRQLAG